MALFLSRSIVHILPSSQSLIPILVGFPNTLLGAMLGINWPENPIGEYFQIAVFLVYLMDLLLGSHDSIPASGWKSRRPIVLVEAVVDCHSVNTSSSPLADLLNSEADLWFCMYSFANLSFVTLLKLSHN